MKIGFSVSKCVLDIVEEHVSIDDVLLIIGSTDFDPTVDEEWKSIWHYYTDILSPYSNPVWVNWQNIEGAEDKFRAIILQLWHDGKIHQPRKFGASPVSSRVTWLEVIPTMDHINDKPAVKVAWEQFQTIAGLSGLKIRKLK